MVISQGDVFWVDFGDPVGSGPAFQRPAVVVQNDAVNRTRIRTAIVCPLTTNLRFADALGNVLLEKNEANLPRRSVAVVSQLTSVDRDMLHEKIGRLSRQHILEVLQGIALILQPAH